MIFLRPYWLILLVIPLLFIWFQRKGATQNPWRQYIAPALMPYLSVSSKVGGGKSRTNWLITIIWCLLTVALAGPAFDKWPTPAVDEAPVTALIVDLNTLNPEKTTQLHLTLYDLVRQLHDNQIGLVLYDTKGYIALPFTHDNEIINSLIPSLQSTVMPAIGNNVAKGFEKADELFKNINQKSGRILLITGGTPDIQSALPLVQKLPYSIGILGIGDEKTGEPITTRSGTFLRDANGQLVLSRPDKATLSQLGTYYNTTPTGNEIKKIIDATMPTETLLQKRKMPDFTDALMQADVWRDLGIYLVCAALPLLALLFRKGVFFILVLGMNTFISSQAAASLWLRPDQESYRTIQAGNKAYKQQDYQKAFDLYESDSTLEALYNKANALAHLGQYQSAIDTYTELLKQNPNHKDSAYNKEYLEKQLQPPQNQQNEQENQQQNQSEQNNESQEKPSEQSQKQPNQSDNTESAENSDTSESDINPASDSTDKSKESEESQEQQQNTPSGDEKQTHEEMSPTPKDIDNTASTSENASDTKDETNQGGTFSNTTEEVEQSDSTDTQAAIENDSSASDVPDQETQQIINRLKKDPARVLRYRLYRQHQGY